MVQFLLEFDHAFRRCPLDDYQRGAATPPGGNPLLLSLSIENLFGPTNLFKVFFSILLISTLPFHFYLILLIDIDISKY